MNKLLVAVMMIACCVPGTGVAQSGMPGHISTELPDSLKSIFVYNQSAPPMMKADSSYSSRGVQIEKITFNNDPSGKVSAFLLLPPKPNHLAILYQHRVGEGYDKSQFLKEATSMALGGFVCLTIDAPWNCPSPKFAAFEQSPYQNDRIGCSNIRKGLDLLASLDDVAISGIFYVGHSFGADMAPRIAALDSRVRGIVVMSGSPFFSRDLMTSTDPAAVAARKEDPEGYEQFVSRFSVLDAGNFIPYVHVPVLFQFGSKDEGLTVTEDKEFYHLANEPKQMHIYDAGHNLNEKARQDRIAWLIAQARSVTRR